jgi:predicted SprT family Zn-dependent metalloprotease
MTAKIHRGNKVNNTYINEECGICHKKFRKFKNILVDIDDDKYVCKSCGTKHHLNVRELSITYSENEI